MSILARTDGTTTSAGSYGTFAVGVVFFISGMPALIYQLLWQRALFTVYGTNVEAVTVVVAGFLLGLGFGSLVGGRISCLAELNLLCVFGATEFATGGFGLISLDAIDAVGQHTLHLPTPALTAVTLFLLFVPTLFMGATLPILSAHLIRSSGNVGRSLGLLYCVNTLGSAVACFLSAFFLMRVAGMQGAVTAAALINFLVGGGALAVAWRRRGERSLFPSAHRGSDAENQRRWSLPRSLILAMLVSGSVGYVALSYEIVWFRAFSLATNASPAFAIVLGTYLAGLANGSLRVRQQMNRGLPHRSAMQATAAALLLASILGFLLLPIAAYGATTAIGFLYPMLLMIFAQTTIIGAIFPLLCDYGVAPDARAGVGVSWIYIANILGSVAGTLVTGFVLTNEMSIGAISALLAAIGAVTAVSVVTFGSVPPGARRTMAATGVVAAIALPLASHPLFARFYEHLLANNVLRPGAPFIETVENRSGVINVGRDLDVYGGGAYDGRIAIDLMEDENALIRPFSLSLFHPDPEAVLMVGLGTGAWAQVIANHPQVRRLTIVEINPGYLEIIRRHPAVASLLDNPKVDIVIDDGRRWLNRHPERRFDAIVQNTTWHYRPNVTNLLSREYLQLVSARLREGGIVMFNTTDSLRVQRTACMLYPGIRELNTMVVAPAPLSPDIERLRRTLGAYRIDGKPVLDTDDPSQRQRLDAIVKALTPPSATASRPDAIMEDCAGILTRSSTLGIVTDDNMGEEWTAMRVNDPMLKRLREVTGLESPRSY